MSKDDNNIPQYRQEIQNKKLFTDLKKKKALFETKDVNTEKKLNVKKTSSKELDKERAKKSQNASIENKKLYKSNTDDLDPQLKKTIEAAYKELDIYDVNKVFAETRSFFEEATKRYAPSLLDNFIKKMDNLESTISSFTEPKKENKLEKNENDKDEYQDRFKQFYKPTEFGDENPTVLHSAKNTKLLNDRELTGLNDAYLKNAIYPKKSNFEHVNPLKQEFQKNVIVILKDSVSKAPVNQEQEKEKQELLTVLNNALKDPQLLLADKPAFKDDEYNKTPKNKTTDYAKDDVVDLQKIPKLDFSAKESLERTSQSKSSSPNTTITPDNSRSNSPSREIEKNNGVSNVPLDDFKKIESIKLKHIQSIAKPAKEKDDKGLENERVKVKVSYFEEVIKQKLVGLNNVKKSPISRT